jgi:hypothetical protein
MRQPWLPWAGTGLGLLLGAATAFGVFCLRVWCGAYEHYAYYGGLAKAGSELMFFSIIGALLGMFLGFNIAKAIVRR